MERESTRRLDSRRVRGIIAAWLGATLLAALALSVAPRWHELLHADANNPGHECAVLHPVWVASPFTGARIFEHAPPALA
jgi:hypothetical protein